MPLVSHRLLTRGRKFLLLMGREVMMCNQNAAGSKFLSALLKKKWEKHNWRAIRGEQKGKGRIFELAASWLIFSGGFARVSMKILESFTLFGMNFVRKVSYQINAVGLLQTTSCQDGFPLFPSITLNYSRLLRRKYG